MVDFGGMCRLLPLTLALGVLLGCGRAPSLAGKLEDIVGVEGEYFPVSPDQRKGFKGNGAVGRTLARIVLAGKPHEPCKCQGRAYFVLRYADGKTVAVTVFKPENTIEVGGDHYVVDMAALTAFLAGLTSP